jgi:flagellar biosynthesis/type III secretory pathway M-ring protein FliF/YscJ
LNNPVFLVVIGVAVVAVVAFLLRWVGRGDEETRMPDDAGRVRPEPDTVATADLDEPDADEDDASDEDDDDDEDDDEDE